MDVEKLENNAKEELEKLKAKLFSLDPDQIKATVQSDVASLGLMVKKHSIMNYVLGGAMIIVMIFASFGMYEMFGSIKDNQKLTQELQKTQQTISQKLETIQQFEKDKEAILEQLKDIKKQQAITNANYLKLLDKVNKPLSQPEQDSFFASRNLVPSYYQEDGGRLFSSPATVKLQTTLVKGEQCEAESALKDKEIGKKDSLISNYESQVKEYKELDYNRVKEVEIVKEDLKKTKKELRKEKFKKWLWTIGIGSLAGYTGYKAGQGH